MDGLDGLSDASEDPRSGPKMQCFILKTELATFCKDRKITCGITIRSVNTNIIATDHFSGHIRAKKAQTASKYFFLKKICLIVIRCLLISAYILDYEALAC